MLKSQLFYLPRSVLIDFFVFFHYADLRMFQTLQVFCYEDDDDDDI